MKSRKRKRSDSADSESQYQVFRNHYDLLVNTISSCPQSITNKLYSKDLISHEVLQRVSNVCIPESLRASILLQHLDATIKCDPTRLRTFLDVLMKEPTCASMAEEIACEFMPNDVGWI